MEIHRKKINPNYLGAVDKKGYVEENFVVFTVKFLSALETTVQLVQQKFDRFSHPSVTRHETSDIEPPGSDVKENEDKMWRRKMPRSRTGPF